MQGIHTYMHLPRSQQVMASALHILQALALGWLLQYLQKGASSGIPGALTGYVFICSSN
jgi:hypothetical protein